MLFGVSRITDPGTVCAIPLSINKRIEIGCDVRKNGTYVVMSRARCFLILLRDSTILMAWNWMMAELLLKLSWRCGNE